MNKQEEPEEIIIYTEDKKIMGVMTKNRYKQLKGNIDFNGRETTPWVECVTCFVIDRESKDIATELRGLNEIDPGEFDLCSGHVKKGELTRTTMARELKEEMKIEGIDEKNIAQNLIFCGKVKMDFTKGKNNNKGKNLRCFATAYAFIVDNKSQVQANDSAVLKIGWASFEKIKNEIRSSNFRFPYTDDTANDYERIFNNVEKVINGRESLIDALSDFEK